MYSYEIVHLLESQNYKIDSDTYTSICHTSPQITRVKYNAYGNYFEIWTDDNNYWKFNVYLKGE